MAFDEAVAERVRTQLRRRKGLSERKMFGGIAFMLNGHMCCGVINNDLVLRLGDDGASKALEQRHTRPMDFTGKPLCSMVYVSPEGYRCDEALRAWVKRAAGFVRTLPAK